MHIYTYIWTLSYSTFIKNVSKQRHTAAQPVKGPSLCSKCVISPPTKINYIGNVKPALWISDVSLLVFLRAFNMSCRDLINMISCICKRVCLFTQIIKKDWNLWSTTRMIQVFLHVFFKSKCFVKQSKCLISCKNIPVHIFKNCNDWLGLMYLITMCAGK